MATQFSRPLNEEEKANTEDIIGSARNVPVVDKAEYVTPVTDVPRDEYSFGDILKESWYQHTSVGAIARTEKSNRVITHDLLFEPQELIKQEDVSEKQAVYLSESNSREQYDARMEEIDKTKQYEQMCAQQGITSTMGAAVLAGTADPMILLAGFGEARALMRGVKTGMVAASVSNVAQEAVIDHIANNRTATDYIIAFAAPTVLGATGTGISKFSKLASEQHRTFADATSKAYDISRKNRVKEGMLAGGSMGAGYTGKGVVDKVISKASDFHALASKGGKELKDFNSLHFSDSIGTGGDTVRTRSTALLSERYNIELKGVGSKQMEILKKKYGDSGDMFDDQLMWELNARKKGETYTDDEVIQEAADVWGRYNAYENRLGTKYNSARHMAEDVNPNYFKQSWKSDVLSNMDRLNKIPQVQRALTTAILKMAKGTVDAEAASVAKKMAVAITDRAMSKATGAKTGYLDIMDNAKEWMKEVLSKHGMDEGNVESTMKILTPDNFKTIHLDYDTPIEGTSMRVGDLINNNSTAMLHAQATEAAGDIALARNGIQDIDAWNAEVEKLLEGVRKTKGDQAAKEARNILDVNLRGIRGQSMEFDPNSGTATAMRRGRDMFSLMTLNQMMFPQLAELNRTIGSVGLKNFISAMPGLQHFITNVRKMDGTARTELIANFEDCGFTVGGNHLLDAKNFRTGEMNSGFATSTVGQRFDNATAWARKQQSRWSGMDNIMDSQHQIAVTAISNRLFKLAQKGIEPDAAFRKRLHDMTLSDADITKVLDNMKNGVADPKSVTGAARTLNLQAWDAQTRDTLFTAMTQYTRQVIQKDMAGESMWWLESTMGKTIGQFKKFPALAFGKQMVHDLKFNDAEMYKTLAYGLALSTAVYHAKTYLNAAGRSDYDEYISRRLDGVAGVTGSIKYAGQLSLAPEAVSTLSGLLGFGDPRQGMQALNNTPALGLPQTVFKGGRGIVKTVGWGDGNDLSMQDVQNMGMLTGVANTIQGKVLFNGVASFMAKNF